MKQIRVEFHLPKHLNNGEQIPISLFHITEQEILNIAGGYNVFDCSGQWMDTAGKTFSDENRVYAITTTNGTARKLRELMNTLKDRFQQEAIFYLENPIRMEFI